MKRAVALFALVILTACNELAQAPAAPSLSQSGVTVGIEPSSAIMIVGTSAQLGASVRNKHGMVQEERPTVWTSSDPSIATVSESGLVTAIAAGGPVSVTASTKGKNVVTAATSITVVVGGRITFQSERDGHAEVYIMDYDGANQTRLTNTASTSYHAAITFDGSRIAFASNRANNFGEIYTMGVDGAGQTRLTFTTPPEYAPQWSADNSRIVFVSERDGFGAASREVYAMNADGTGQVRLTANGAQEDAPAFAPDGRIIFESNRDGNVELYVMNGDGSNVVRLTNHLAYDGVAHWSPDGSRIAFMSDRSGDMEIYVMNADGSNPVNISNAPSSFDGAPRWSPDSRNLVFHSNRSGQDQMYTMRADGSGVTQLTFIGANAHGSWGR